MMLLFSWSGSGSRYTTSPYGDLGSEEIMLDLCGQLYRAGVDVESWNSRQGRGNNCDTSYYCFT